MLRKITFRSPIRRGPVRTAFYRTFVTAVTLYSGATDARGRLSSVSWRVALTAHSSKRTRRRRPLRPRTEIIILITTIIMYNVSTERPRCRLSSRKQSYMSTSTLVVRFVLVLYRRVEKKKEQSITKVRCFNSTRYLFTYTAVACWQGRLEVLFTSDHWSYRRIRRKRLDFTAS